MKLLDLPLSTELSATEKKIARAFFGHTGPVDDVYRHLAQALHLKIEEIKAIEKAMARRILAEAAPDTSVLPAGDYGHGAMFIDLLEAHHADAN